MIKRIEDTVLPPLATATVERDDGATLGSAAVEDLDRFGGDLTAMVEDAVFAFHERNNGAAGLVKASQCALDGKKGKRAAENLPSTLAMVTHTRLRTSCSTV